MKKVDLLIEHTASCFLILKKIKLCDLQKAITQYMLLETKYKMKRYILKIGKIQNGQVLPLQRTIPSIYKNSVFPPLLSKTHQRKEDWIAFIVRTKYL